MQVALACTLHIPDTVLSIPLGSETAMLGLAAASCPDVAPSLPELNAHVCSPKDTCRMG